MAAEVSKNVIAIAITLAIVVSAIGTFTVVEEVDNSVEVHKVDNTETAKAKFSVENVDTEEVTDETEGNVGFEKLPT